MGQTLSYIIPNNIQINIFEFDSAAPWKDKSLEQNYAKSWHVMGY